MSVIVQKKLERLERGEPLRVLDLFAGCGGLSLGFRRAGCEIVASVEADELAAQTHAYNFHAGEAAHARVRDITAVEPAEVTLSLGLGAARYAFDILIGGPPCQAYARIGRAKLRDIAEHPEAFRVDERANLYLRYLHFVRCTQPLGILMENVPDIMNFGGHNVMQEIAETLEGYGYLTKYTLTNAAHYGVPQFRDRVFLVAWRKEIGIDPAFPEPTHWAALPKGYNGTRAVALKHLGLFDGGNFVLATEPSPDLPPTPTAAEALDDLPPITSHLTGEMRRGARRFTELARYRRRKPSEYARLMRDWRGFESDTGVFDHVIRLLPRDAPIFRAMESGAEYPAAHATAMALFEAECARYRRRNGHAMTKQRSDELKRAMVPPYPLGSFPNRWWKLHSGQPSRTLLAHLGKDSYTHIHYDSAQARTISVREAARLQSFPDGFKFAGTMNPAFRQIGNAVPPLLAWKIATQMQHSLQRAIKGRSGGRSTRGTVRRSA